MGMHRTTATESELERELKAVLQYRVVLGIYPTSHTILPVVSAQTLRMRVTQPPNLHHFLTHCEHFLWLWFGLVKSRRHIMIRVGRFLRTAALLSS